jgi:hypothetical protein
VFNSALLWIRSCRSMISFTWQLPNLWIRIHAADFIYVRVSSAIHHPHTFIPTTDYTITVNRGRLWHQNVRPMTMSDSRLYIWSVINVFQSWISTVCSNGWSHHVGIRTVFQFWTACSLNELSISVSEFPFLKISTPSRPIHMIIFGIIEKITV